MSSLSLPVNEWNERRIFCDVYFFMLISDFASTAFSLLLCRPQTSIPPPIISHLHCSIFYCCFSLIFWLFLVFIFSYCCCWLVACCPLLWLTLLLTLFCLVIWFLSRSSRSHFTRSLSSGYVLIEIEFCSSFFDLFPRRKIWSVVLLACYCVFGNVGRAEEATA